MIFINTFLQKLYSDAEILNDANVATAIKRTGPHSVILDVGCWDGAKTLVWGEAAKSRKIYGIETVASSCRLAKAKGVIVSNVKADHDVWPIKDASVDCVISNQVVEHLSDLDFYFMEAHRVLKFGGYLITSTNNLASLHNIASLVLGWAPFDLTNSSSKVGGIGNKFALHRGESDPRGSSWTHKCIYTSYWLQDWQEQYGFKFIETLGAGLYPLPASFGSILKTYCAFITLITKKI